MNTDKNDFIPLKFHPYIVKKFCFDTLLKDKSGITDILYNAEFLKNTLLNRYEEIDPDSLKEILKKIEESGRKYGHSILLDSCYAACCFCLFKREGNAEYLKDSLLTVEKLLAKTYLISPGTCFDALYTLYQKLSLFSEFSGIVKNMYHGNFFVYTGNCKQTDLFTISLENETVAGPGSGFFPIPSGFGKSELVRRKLEIRIKDKLLLSDDIDVLSKDSILNLACVCSEKSIYSTHERPALFFIFPGKPHMNFSFTVRSVILDTDIVEENLATDIWGTASYCLDTELPPGEYSIRIKDHDHRPYSFTITGYSYSPLVKIENYDVITEIKDEKQDKDESENTFLDMITREDSGSSTANDRKDLIHYKLLVRLFNQPYNGELYCGLEESFAFYPGTFSGIIDITDGRGDFEAPPLWNLGHTFFHYDSIQFRTPEGFRYQMKLESDLLALTGIHSVSCYSIKLSESGDPDFFGYKRNIINHDNSIIRKEEKSRDNAIRFFLNKNITCGCVYALDEKGEKYQEFVLDERKAGSAIELEGSHIYSIVVMGLLCADDNLFYEIKTFTLFPAPFIHMDLPEKVQPGMGVPVVIRSQEKCKVLLSVTDSRMKKENPDEQLVLTLTRHLMGIQTRSYTYEPDYNEILSGISVYDFLNIGYTDESVLFQHRLKNSVVREDIAESFSSSEKITDNRAQKPGEITTQMTRNDFRDVLYFDAFEVEGEKTLSITMNDRITEWDIRATAVFPHTINSCRKNLESAKPFYAEPDIPAFMSPGDNVEAAVFTVLPEGETAVLTLKGPGIKVSRSVEKTGLLYFYLTGPGKIEVELHSNKFKDRQEQIIRAPGTMERYGVSMKYFKTGETISEETILYENELYFGKDILESLLQYPFGCAEQISAKMYGLILAYKAIQSGFDGLPVHRVEKLISRGIKQLDQFFSSDKGLFSLWEGGVPSAFVTVKILSYFIPFLHTKFEEILKYIETGSESLLRRKVKANCLLPINPDFRVSSGINGISDACYLYFTPAGPEEKKACAEYIINNVQVENNVAFWPGKDFWGGTMEATAKALKIVAIENHHDLVEKGLFYLTAKLKNNRLYSTSDTTAFIELLLSLKDKDNPDPVIIDKENTGIKLTGRTKVNNCTIKQGKVLGMQYHKEETNVLDSHYDNLDFDLAVSKINIKTGEKFDLTITITEKIKCPVVSIFLPPVLCSVTHGIKSQRIDVPMKYESISFELFGIAPGKGKLYVLVYDMYDEEKKAVYSTDIQVLGKMEKSKFSQKEKQRLLKDKERKKSGSSGSLSDI
ncbi:MAG: hypothetical protein JXB88_02950 [Spirochaetales bacterium]|nr:hypothetical protein [Spirochaetales bacterium]